jgi:hypothetical protein
MSAFPRGEQVLDQCEQRASALFGPYKASSGCTLWNPIAARSQIYSRLNLTFWIFKMPVFSRLAVALQLFAVILSPVLGAAAKPQYDYVIVGGGVTGLIVANRITEDKNSTYFGPCVP